jgi:multiple sugar transport system substrate-binding protein
MKKTKIGLILLAASLLTLLGGCGNSGESPEDGKTNFIIATWAAGTELKEFQEIVNDVNEKADGRYTVEILSIPSDYYIKISTYIASKKTPDFFWLSQELISKYASLGAIADITEQFLNSEILKPGQFYEGVLSTAEYQGKYYGLPWIANPSMVYYNKKLFDEAGVPYPAADDDWTWDEFIEIAKQLSKIQIDSFGNEYQQYGYIVDGWPNIETFIWAGGGDIIGRDGETILIDSEETLKGLEILHNILGSGITPAYSEIASLGTRDVWFVKQRAAMFMGGIQDDFERRASELPEDETFAIGYAPMPVGLDGTASSFDWTASTVMDVNLAGNALAYEVMEAMTLAFFEWKVAPPIKGTIENVAKIDPRKADALETIEIVLNQARSANYIPEWNEINTFLWVRLYTKMLNDSSFDYMSEARVIAEESRKLIQNRK